MATARARVRTGKAAKESAKAADALESMRLELMLTKQVVEMDPAQIKPRARAEKLRRQAERLNAWACYYDRQTYAAEIISGGR